MRHYKLQDIPILVCIHLCTGEAGGYCVQAGGVQGLQVPRQAVPGKVQAGGLVTVTRGQAAPDGGHAPLLRRYKVTPAPGYWLLVTWVQVV